MKNVILSIVLLILSACHLGSVNIFHTDLQVAVVDDIYEDYFSIDTSWNDYFNYGHRFYLTDGEIPSGLEVTNGGRLLGIPRELGAFNFEISVYGINFNGSEDWIDSAWYTVFVTQDSTNEDCPTVTTQSASELFICLGHLQEETVNAAELINLDVQYSLPSELGNKYAINHIVFTINYDADSFEPVTDRLNSSLLKEVATHADATVAFENNPGSLVITLEAQHKDYTFSWPGRLMNIPLRAKKDLSESEYIFTANINTMTSKKDNVDLPEMIDLDGLLKVDDPIVPIDATITDTTT